MPKGPRAPSARDVLQIAADFGIEMEADEAATYARLMAPALHAFRRLEELPEQKPPVKYPRTPGYRPSAGDNA